MLDKSLIRRELIAIRKNLFSIDENNLIIQNILSILQIYPHSRVGLYHPIIGEPNLLSVIQNIPNEICLPKIINANLQFVRYKFNDELKPSKFSQILEPSGNEVLLPDILIIPAIAFSLKGDRIGFGYGHYDKYLAAAAKIIKIGVCFHQQVFINLPVEEHDQSMNYIVTNKILIICN